MNKPTIFLCCLAVAIVVSIQASQAGYSDYGGKNLGGVNLNYYCQKTFGSGFKFVLVGKTAGNWTCQQSQNERRSISVENACKLQYGKPNLKAKALNWNDPLSWRCFELRRPQRRG